MNLTVLIKTEHNTQAYSFNSGLYCVFYLSIVIQTMRTFMKKEFHRIYFFIAIDYIVWTHSFCIQYHTRQRNFFFSNMLKCIIIYLAWNPVKLSF